jgi:hypothetical protein
MMRQDNYEFEASLGYVAKPCLKQSNNKKGCPVKYCSHFTEEIYEF